MLIPDQQTGVRLVVEPESCLHDEPVSIRVEGLQSGQPVTISTTMTDTRKVQYLSYAQYIANELGVVDVGKMESLGGRYKGVFPMGLIGTLQPAPKEYKYTRFFKRDVQNPNVVTVNVHRGHQSAEELCGGGGGGGGGGLSAPPGPPPPPPPLASTTHYRHYMGPGVQRVPVRYGKVRGCLFLPKGPGPFPGVVDMFGTAGGLLEYRSAQLASRGFASLALAFFGYDDLPKHLEEFDISYFEEAVEFLLKHDKILKSGVGVIGTSKGGDLALSVAAFIPTVLACVTINGCNAPLDVNMRVKDQIYSHIPYWDLGMVRITDDGVIEMSNASVHPNAYKGLALPIEKSNAAFLFLVGSDDKDLNSEMYAQEAFRKLLDNNYPHDYEVSSYPGTGHLLEPPYSPHCRASFQHSQMLAICWGGTDKYHISGQEAAWTKMINFLWHHLVHLHTPIKHSGTPVYHTHLKHHL